MNIISEQKQYKNSSTAKIRNNGTIDVSYLPPCFFSLLSSPDEAVTSTNIQMIPFVKDDIFCVRSWFFIDIYSFVEKNTLVTAFTKRNN